MLFGLVKKSLYLVTKKENDWRKKTEMELEQEHQGRLFLETVSLSPWA